VPQGDRLIIEMPGGGGSGDPLGRAPESVLKDTRNGLISLESAEQDYGVVIRDGAVDTEATAHRRAEGRTNSAGEA